MFLARLVPRKGVADFIKALAFVDPETLNKTKIIVAGDGVERSRAEYLATKEGLSIDFAGEVVGEAKEQLYGDCDIFVAPCVDEGFGLTILEAMANGCAIVAYQNDVLVNTLSGYPDPGLIVPQGDIEGLARGITKLIRDTKLRTELGKWGVERARQFTWKKVAEQTLNFYEELMKKKNQ